VFRRLDYLNDHPDAQDTTEGIMDWWLLQANISYQSSRVNEVLKALTAKNVVLEQNRLGSIVYKLNPEKKNEVSALLKLIKPENS
jgi:hypothetical protein